MKKIIISLFAVATLSVMLSPLMQTTNATTFKDVSSSHWAKAAIDEAVSKGYFKGYADGTFKPGAQVTRAEFAVLLDRVSSNEKVEGKGTFTDLTGNWSEKEVNEAIAKGFLTPSDYPNGFKPATPLTRKEMAKWMSSGLATSSADYRQALSDTANTVVPVAEYFKKTMNPSEYPYVSLMMGTGLMSGYADGTFGAGKTTTRAEAAVILVRLANVQKQSADSFVGLKELRAVGTTGTNMEVITPFSSGVTSFKNVQGKKMKFRNGAGYSNLNYLIFVDSRDWNNKKGIYSPVFLGKEDKLKKEGTFYRVYANQSLYPTLNGFSIEHYKNSSLSRLAVGSSIASKLPEKYGYQTLPIFEPQTIFKKYINDKDGMNLWMQNTISTDYPNNTYITDDGSRFLIK
ncbi:S-layer homology domain-containing protein [Paenibacillus sp. KACC 21273]|uniref:S-layer homology domain-containing protein n=1 Tax=Paenibacillus sp. KACC 21273 TaxID=3025665 RepID=UPI0023668BB0|nr:S-layer homology domain-containing protein [Paenibacillus sp. KACC 21273]WDF49114.1 S-layer homology domain-containing protein [Paenibacillus sp. KACC 21273]